MKDSELDVSTVLLACYNSSFRCCASYCSNVFAILLAAYDGVLMFVWCCEQLQKRAEQMKKSLEQQEMELEDKRRMLEKEITLWEETQGDDPVMMEGSSM